MGKEILTQPQVIKNLELVGAYSDGVKNYVSVVVDGVNYSLELVPPTLPPVPSPTPTPTITQTLTLTPTPTPTETETPTPTPTETETPTPTPTETETPTPTPTETETPTPTPTITPTVTPSKAQDLLAEDIASNAAYDDGFSNGDNGGSGFEPWIVENNNGSGFTGQFVGGVGGGFGDINTSGESFGAYANPEGSGASTYLTRHITGGLTKGYSVSAALAIQFRNGFKGVEVLDTDGNSAAIFEVAGNNYTFNGVNYNDWTYDGSSIFELSGHQSDINTCRFVIRRRGTLDVSSIVTYTGVISSLLFYIGDTENAGENNLYFNSLKVYYTGW